MQAMGLMSRRIDNWGHVSDPIIPSINESDFSRISGPMFPLVNLHWWLAWWSRNYMASI